MRNVRLIARLDVKAPNLVKGIQLEGLRKLGDPNEFALRYYQEGIDEIYYEDIDPMLEYVLLIGDINGTYAIPSYTIQSYNEADLDVTDYPYTFFDNNPLEPNFFIGRWSIRSLDEGLLQASKESKEVR